MAAARVLLNGFSYAPGRGAVDSSLLEPLPASWSDVDFDVVVVGAGPSGLACAHAAVQNGASCLVVDARPGVSEKARPCRVHYSLRSANNSSPLCSLQDSKCTGIRPRSIEILEQCGALARLGGVEALQAVCDLPVYSCSAQAGPTRLLYSLRAAAPTHGRFGAPPARACVAYSCEQWRVESALVDALAEQPRAQLRRGVRCAAFTAQPGGVEVTLEVAALGDPAAAQPDAAEGWEVVGAPAPTPSASTRVRCKYLVGCDGVNSGVRASLGCGRDGGAYEELFLIADVQLEGYNLDLHSRPTFLHGEPEAEAQLRFITRDLHCAPLGGGKARLFFVVDAGAPRADLLAAFRQLPCGPSPSDAQCGAALAWMQAALGEYGLHGWRLTRLLRLSRYSVWLGCARLARGACEGRVFLAGDAAHSHSPHGGQGANAGLQDGWNLGWKLALACRPQAGATCALLASYAAERQPVWRAVVRMADALKQVSATPHARGWRDAALRALWRALPDEWQRQLLLERLAHKRFAYPHPLGCEDAGRGAAQPGTRALPGPRGGAAPGLQPGNAWVVQLSGGAGDGHRRQCSLQEALWGCGHPPGFRLLLLAPGVSARVAGIRWGRAARRQARALALVVLAWAVGGARAGLTAAALWAVACRRLLAGTLTQAPPMAPPWEAYAALADRAARVPGLAGLRTLVLLPEGTPLPAEGIPPTLQALIDVEGAGAEACGGRGGEAMLLLRPDGHTALRAARVAWQPLADYLPRLFTRLGADEDARAGRPTSI